jgi:hypothetical protein
MHVFAHTLYFVLKLLMRLAMWFTGEKTYYLIAPESILSYITVDRIWKLGHLLPSLIISVLIGVKILPELWPYYAEELNKNGLVISIVMCLIFIPAAIINGIIIEKILKVVNPNYLDFKRSLESRDGW